MRLYKLWGTQKSHLIIMILSNPIFMSKLQYFIFLKHSFRKVYNSLKFPLISRPQKVHISSFHWLLCWIYEFVTTCIIAQTRSLLFRSTIEGIYRASVFLNCVNNNPKWFTQLYLYDDDVNTRKSNFFYALAHTWTDSRRETKKICFLSLVEKKRKFK